MCFELLGGPRLAVYGYRDRVPLCEENARREGVTNVLRIVNDQNVCHEKLICLTIIVGKSAKDCFEVLIGQINVNLF